MASYDPKRTRPPAPDLTVDEPAPVDALLDPTIPRPSAPTSPPTVVADPPPVVSQSDPNRQADPVPAVAAGDPIPVDVPVAPAPDRLTARLAVVSGVAAATVAAILLIRRSRRR